jgi:hypothetical protein
MIPSNACCCTGRGRTCGIQHIYEKLGVSTRAGATLFAVEHDLLTPTA